MGPRLRVVDTGVDYRDHTPCQHNRPSLHPNQGKHPNNAPAQGRQRCPSLKVGVSCDEGSRRTLVFPRDPSPVARLPSDIHKVLEGTSGGDSCLDSLARDFGDYDSREVVAFHPGGSLRGRYGGRTRIGTKLGGRTDVDDEGDRLSTRVRKPRNVLSHHPRLGTQLRNERPRLTPVEVGHTRDLRRWEPVRARVEVFRGEVC